MNQRETERQAKFLAACVLERSLGIGEFIMDSPEETTIAEEAVRKIVERLFEQSGYKTGAIPFPGIQNSAPNGEKNEDT